MLQLVKAECRSFIVQAQTLLEEGRRMKKAKRHGSGSSRVDSSSKAAQSQYPGAKQPAETTHVQHPEQLSPQQSLDGSLLPGQSVVYYKSFAPNTSEADDSMWTSTSPGQSQSLHSSFTRRSK